MAKFNLYIPILKKWEGGFSNHPKDKGGATYKGITIATFRDIYGKDKTVKDLKNMTEEQWLYIVRIYWNACNADKINNQSIANLVVDWGFNSGVTGRKNVQRAIGVYADGIFGPKTLEALNRQPSKCVFCKIRDARESFFRSRVEKDPSQIDFLDGWMNRLNDFIFEP